MGLFDTIHCFLPLPGFPDAGPFRAFQTKSLDCALSTFQITPDGRLTNERGFKLDFDGTILFYGQLNGHETVFRAEFSQGRLDHLYRDGDAANKTPWEAGYDAASKNYCSYENPYTSQPDAESWDDGWSAYLSDHAEPS